MSINVYLGTDGSVRAIIFATDSRFPDTFFFFTYSISLISASFGMAKVRL